MIHDGDNSAVIERQSASFIHKQPSDKAQEQLQQDKDSVSSVAQASILTCHYSVGYVAFAPHVVAGIQAISQVEPVPAMPYYALGLMRWQGKWIPLIHFDSLILAYPLKDKHTLPTHCLILAYQAYPGADISHGALAINTSELINVTVSDADACSLPLNSDLWQTIAKSCFKYQDRPTPIIDVAKLFNTSYD